MSLYSYFRQDARKTYARMSVTRGGGDFEVLRPAGRHTVPIGEMMDSSTPNFTPMVKGFGVYDPENCNVTQFPNINAPQGRISFAILRNFQRLWAVSCSVNY